VPGGSNCAVPAPLPVSTLPDLVQVVKGIDGPGPPRRGHVQVQSTRGCHAWETLCQLRLQGVRPWCTGTVTEEPTPHPWAWLLPCKLPLRGGALESEWRSGLGRAQRRSSWRRGANEGRTGALSLPGEPARWVCQVGIPGGDVRWRTTRGDACRGCRGDSVPQRNVLRSPSPRAHVHS